MKLLKVIFILNTGYLSSSSAITLKCDANLYRQQWTSILVQQPSMGGPEKFTLYNEHKLGASYSPGLGGESQDTLFMRMDAREFRISAPSKTSHYQVTDDDGTEFSCRFEEDTKLSDVSLQK